MFTAVRPVAARTACLEQAKWSSASPAHADTAAAADERTTPVHNYVVDACGAVRAHALKQSACQSLKARLTSCLCRCTSPSVTQVRAHPDAACGMLCLVKCHQAGCLHVACPGTCQGQDGVQAMARASLARLAPPACPRSSVPRCQVRPFAVAGPPCPCLWLSAREAHQLD